MVLSTVQCLNSYPGHIFNYRAPQRSRLCLSTLTQWAKLRRRTYVGPCDQVCTTTSPARERLPGRYPDRDLARTSRNITSFSHSIFPLELLLRKLFSLERDILQHAPITSLHVLLLSRSILFIYNYSSLNTHRYYIVKHTKFFYFIILGTSGT